MQNKTLKDFLQSPDQTIKRHAMGIEKRLQNIENCYYCHKEKHKEPTECIYYGSGVRGNEI